MSLTTDHYRTGATTLFASRVDQRFSYCLYIPDRRDGDPERYPVVVLQHSTDREPLAYRDAFAEFCEEHRAIAFAPLFPAGIVDPDDIHNYKFFEFHGIRFDLLLLDMLEEAAERYPMDVSRFLLHGFSGGGQFTQRFLLLHPDRLLGASVGAPGRLTMIDDSRNWWLGTADVQERFGIGLDPAAIARVPVQLVVGSVDIETWETLDRTESTWIDGLEAQGDTRVDRLRAFERNLRRHGVEPRFDLVPGVAHQPFEVLPPVKRFFSQILRDRAAIHVPTPEGAHR